MENKKEKVNITIVMSNPKGVAKGRGKGKCL